MSNIKVESLSCAHCGVPLDVPERANFVRCNRCGSRLAVQRHASITLTERLEDSAESVDALAREALRKELERIDWKWANRCGPYWAGITFSLGAAVVVGGAATILESGLFGPLVMATAAISGIAAVICLLAHHSQAWQRYRERRESLTLDVARRWNLEGEWPVASEPTAKAREDSEHNRVNRAEFFLRDHGVVLRREHPTIET